MGFWAVLQIYSIYLHILQNICWKSPNLRALHQFQNWSYACFRKRCTGGRYPPLRQLSSAGGWYPPLQSSRAKFRLS